MNYGKTLAYTQMAVCFAAACGYLAVKDYRRTVYWICAGLITLTVTLE